MCRYNLLYCVHIFECRTIRYVSCVNLTVFGVVSEFIPILNCSLYNTVLIVNVDVSVNL